MYFKPKTEEETSKLLKEYGTRSKIIAGGTGIYELAHRGLLSEVEALIDVTALDLHYVRTEGDSIRIGSCTTMSAMMEENRQIGSRPELSALSQALRLIQPLQVKNVATIAGAICTGLPFFDLPVALVALDASVLVAPLGRTVHIEEFIQGYFSIDLGPGEFVKEIVIPLNKGSAAGSAFQKFALTGDDWAIINCGAWIRVRNRASPEIAEARVCFGGGVGEKPKRVKNVERLLRGVGADDEEKFKEILSDNLAELETTSDMRASSEYRSHLANVFGRRALIDAGKRALESIGVEGDNI